MVKRARVFPAFRFKAGVIASANISAWMRSPRTAVMLAFIAAICFSGVDAVNRAMAQRGYQLAFGEKLFYHLYDGCNIKMTSIMFLVMISELPRRMAFQNDMLIRTKKRTWLAGQLLYCAGTTLGMLVLVALCAALFSIGHYGPGSGWTETALVESSLLLDEQTVIPKLFRQNLTPLTASGLALVPMLLFWFAITLVILLCSLMGAANLGLLLCGTAIVADTLSSAVPVNPLAFSSLWGMGLAWRDAPWQYYGGVIIGYLALEGLLIALCFLSMKYRDVSAFAE